MDRYPLPSVEAKNKTSFNDYYLNGQFELSSILELTSPDDNWQTPLEQARQYLVDAMHSARNYRNYCQAHIMYESAPTFTLPLLGNTVAPELITSNFKRTRKAFVDMAVDIDLQIIENDHNLAATHSPEKRASYKREIADLLGIGSEVSVIAALLTSDIYKKGFVPVPAFTWQDDVKHGVSGHQHTTSPKESPAFDIILLPINAASSPIKLQIKTGKKYSKEYADDIHVIRCSKLVRQLKEVFGVNVYHINTLPALYRYLSDNELRAQAVRQTGELLRSELGLDRPITKTELAS